MVVLLLSSFIGSLVDGDEVVLLVVVVVLVGVAICIIMVALSEHLFCRFPLLVGTLLDWREHAVVIGRRTEVVGRRGTTFARGNCALVVQIGFSSLLHHPIAQLALRALN